MITTLPPGAEVDIPDPFPLGRTAVESAKFIAGLRDLMSAGAVARWRGAVTPALTESAALHHLPPPHGAEEVLGPWRSRFRLGLCYYRRGPDFIHIKDIRDPSAGAAYVLDDPLLVRAFTRCLSPTRLPDVAVDERAAIDLLLAEHLLLRLDDCVVTLPYHMRRWPIPATLV